MLQGITLGAKQIKSWGLRLKNFMTKIDKYLRVALIIVLSAYQMIHIAAVEGWYVAGMIEATIIIASILRTNVVLVLVLFISTGFVLSYHFDSGFVLSFKSGTEIIMSFAIPFISAHLSRTKEEPIVLTEPVTNETPLKINKTVKKRQKPASVLSAQVFKLKDSGHSIRQIADQTMWSKGQVERILKQRVA